MDDLDRINTFYSMAPFFFQLQFLLCRNSFFYLVASPPPQPTPFFLQKDNTLSITCP